MQLKALQILSFCPNGMRGMAPNTEPSADDMKVAAVSLIGPLLPVLYNCTPGQPPKFSP